MARQKKGAARAAAPGSLFVWVNTQSGRQLKSRRWLAANGGAEAIEAAPEPTADEAIEAVDADEAEETERTEVTTPVAPVNSAKAAPRKRTTRKSKN